MNLRKIIKAILFLAVSILFIGGIGVWAKYNYNNIVNYDEVQQENKNEIRQEYVNTLYENKELSRNDVIDTIFLKDLEKLHVDFTESRPEDFIKEKIESYTVNDQIISFDVSGKTDKKEYDVNNLLLVDVTNKSTSKLKLDDNILKTEDNEIVNLKDSEFYGIINYANDKNSDDVFIVTK